MSTSQKQDLDFNRMIGEELPKSMLQTCIDWIRDNMSPDSVWPQEELNKFVSNTQQPDDVFTREELTAWAIEKGFAAPEKTETEVFIEKVLKG